ncbi:NF-X1-type zinc finger protein NFXL1 isoform X2 [Anastrepha ludens]|uniref:NF-X1-type zinc finger protein NFXL1 isoform X2 n=1 Tax=Anastrepha ludens TaxID=28586 RepID=UPI0023AE72B5|nr:NF-X1-type zinc finger protein NFXL1 isoform X2 [Anastrepha ludens]
MSNFSVNNEKIRKGSEPNQQKSSGVKRFEEVHARNIAAAKKIVENYASSSDEYEEELNESEILDSLYKHYECKPSTFGGTSALQQKSAAFFENALYSGSATCLICIGSVRRTDSIWACKHCYCFFHLNCIRRWANDSIAQMRGKSLGNPTFDHAYIHSSGISIGPRRKGALLWSCPQCRKDYTDEEKPSTYECFCGKETNPKPESFLLPHSCGEICGKKLQPACGHTCMLLCHPGPCPPCSQYANTSCLCGKSPRKSVRCIDKEWKCDIKCKELLPCGEHQCQEICHKPKQCPPCTSTSIQPCECGNQMKNRNCFDLKWNCNKQKVVPCTESIDPCGDTCQKLLSCKLHTCTQRCHRGDCNLCLIITKKKCRCGILEKELPCWKNFTCEIKCKRMRDCGKHTCNKKCCDGRVCQQCDKICGKPLTCHKHKCQSVCHDGPCYPCNQQSQVNCRCGKTSKRVPCGRERTARVMCMEFCRIPSKCHHPNKHRCHKSECPPCNQKCGQPNSTTGCQHICEAKCHAAIKVVKQNAENGNAKVWDIGKKFEFKMLPHPPCEQKVSVTCIGGHEIADWLCWNSKPTSCQRKCNRELRCGNHKCELVCHSVPDLQDMKEQIGCARCQEGCNIPRPTGCVHACSRPCHPPPCNPCDKIIKHKCYCGLTQVMYKCSEYFSDEGTKEEVNLRQERLKSCGNRCLKNLPCGHRCHTPCHPGKCPNPELCRKKVRIFCECKRLKVEVACDKHRAGQTSIPCDEFCIETHAKLAEQRKRELERLRQLEEAKNRAEVEQFEKKFSKRKYKERKVVVEETKRNINWKLIGIYVGIGVAVVTAIAVAFYP